MDGNDVQGQPTNTADFNFRLTHFDHLPGAFLVVFQCMTCEGWTDIMYMLQDAHNDYFASVYFCLLILLTSFFLLNVALAVMGDTFSRLSEGPQEDEDEAKETEEEEAPK